MPVRFALLPLFSLASSLCTLLLPLAAASLTARETLGAEPSRPLHVRVDALLESQLTSPPAGQAADGVRLRRLHLDLTGVIPTAAETRAFLADRSPDKWTRTVDQLLQSELHIRHLANWLDVTLMERRADKHVKRETWESYLLESVRANRPFDELAAEILGADGRDADHRAPAKFYLEREAEPNLLTRDIGRVFFGLDMQCAQCHDHPLIADYYQSDYYGLYSFVSRLSLFADKKQKISYLAEKPMGEVMFTSVFTEAEGRTNPRLPGDREIAEDPVFPSAETYRIKPSKEVGGVPKYSRREQLAKAVARGENFAFRRNLANRLWALMMGRGLVDPLDLHHSDNPPSHPELLAMLTEEIAALDFDIRAFLRELALTNAYQRDYALSPGWHTKVPADFETQRQTWERQRDDASELLEAAELQHAELQQTYYDTRQQREIADEKVKAALAVVAAKQAAYDKAAAPLETLKQKLARDATTLEALQAARQALQASGVVAEAASAEKVLAAKQQAIEAARVKDLAEQTKLSAAVAPAQKALQQAKATVPPAQAKVEPLTVAARDAEAKMQAAAAEMHQREQTYSQLQLKLDESAAWLAAATAVKQVESAQDDLAAAEQQLQPLDDSRRPLVAQRDRLRSKLAAAENQVAKAEQAVTQAKQAATGAKRVETLLSEAVAALSKPDVAEAAQVELLLTRRESAAEDEAQAMAQALDAAELRRDKAQEAMAQTSKELDTTTAELTSLEPSWKAATQQRQAAQVKLQAAKAPLAELIRELEAMQSKRFALTGLKALTPEQLCWSILQATGQLALQRVAAKAALDKKQPLSEQDRMDPAKVAARQAAIQSQAHDKLKGNVRTFVGLFAAAAGQPQDGFFATADQALFFRNGSQIRGWIAAGGNSLYQRLRNLESAEQVAEEAYLSVLSRRPETQETKAVVEYLQVEPEQRDAALQEVVWALCTSIEFRFRH